MNARLVCGCLAVVLSGCPRSRPPPVDAAVARPDAERVPAVAEIPPPGPSADGQEVDVPLRWIHLLAEPAPTGSTPYAVVGATVPCGFVPRYTVSERAEREIRLRMRAQRGGPDGSACVAGRAVVELVSLSLLRLGDWRVVDAVAHGEGDVPAPTPRVLHVVADDTTLAPAAERWTRPCSATADCAAGGVCARAASGTLCLPPMDPWLHLGRPCPEGTRSVAVAPVDAAEGAPWRACVAACDGGGRCPGALRCDPSGICLPPSRVDGGTSGAPRGPSIQGPGAAGR
ncbi:MAG: hypothetical protein Q8S73_14740 [Deltaproteobacteria bacterium]|nr:hypothetical protein [Myxococcales bacterium]MDP3215362.1 hypothetical protein [Deltaproteobacteria bacterium]